MSGPALAQRSPEVDVVEAGRRIVNAEAGRQALDDLQRITVKRRPLITVTAGRVEWTGPSPKRDGPAGREREAVATDPEGLPTVKALGVLFEVATKPELAWQVHHLADHPLWSGRPQTVGRLVGAAHRAAVADVHRARQKKGVCHYCRATNRELVDWSPAGGSDVLDGLDDGTTGFEASGVPGDLGATHQPPRICRPCAGQLQETGIKPRPAAQANRWRESPVEAVICARETAREVAGMVDRLPGRQRHIAALGLDGFEVAEMADMLGLAASTAHTHFTRAAENLRNLVEHVE